MKKYEIPTAEILRFEEDYAIRTISDTTATGITDKTYFWIISETKKQ